MMTIAPVARGEGQYYVQLAREDYYAQGGESCGEWYGEGAKKLGLTGHINPRVFANLLKGLDPAGQVPLVQLKAIRHDRKHRAGWYLVFSAPKSVSALWAAASPEVRRITEAAQLRSVHVGLAYMQDEAAVTRRGPGGSVRERAELVVALFPHAANRNQEPQVHTHAVVLNVAGRTDGTFGTLDSQPFFEHQCAAGAAYRAELAATLRRELGVRIAPDGEFFRLPDVPEGLVKHWSSRGAEIQAEMAARGVSSAKEAEKAALHTRKRKESVAQSVLDSDWRATAKRFGFGDEQVAQALNRIDRLGPEQFKGRSEAVVKGAVQILAEDRGWFSVAEVTRFAASQAPAAGVPFVEIRERISDLLLGSKSLFAVITLDGRKLFAPQKQRRFEQLILKSLNHLARSNSHALSEKYVRKAMNKIPGLSDEQQNVLMRTTSGLGDIQCIDGWAGTGKTTVLKEAKKIWEEAGKTVIPVSHMGTAARVLDNRGGGRARTVANFNARVNPGIRKEIAHHVRQMIRAARRKTTFSFDRERLTADTVLVVESAQTLSTRAMSKLLANVSRARAKVVLAGDTAELPGIDRRHSFQLIAERVGAIRLHAVQRPVEEWARHAVTQMAEGDVLGALKQFALAERFHVASDQGSVKEALIREWKKHRASELPNTLIIANSKEEVADLNRLAQRARQSEGAVGTLLTQRANGTWMYRGDRVLFTASSKLSGFETGDTGTIEQFGLDTITVKLDRMKKILGYELDVRVVVKRKQYSSLQLGYAVTTFRSQEMSADNAYVLLDPTVRNYQAAYVQLSRARDGTQIYTCHKNACDAVHEASRVVWSSIALDLVAQTFRQKPNTPSQGVTP